jgi:chromosome segregation ATPase
MADTEVKFTQEELDKIQSFQQQYGNLQLQFGQSHITQLRLEEQLNSIDEMINNLNNNLTTLQEEERNFITEINKKYGDGVLNPETGVFTPAEPTDTTTDNK